MIKPATVFDILRQWQTLGDIAKPDTIPTGKRYETKTGKVRKIPAKRDRYMLYLSGRRYALHDTLTQAKRYAHRLHACKPKARIVIRDRKTRRIVFTFN